MRVIPVVDLMAGTVVRAQGGLRETYRPIVTPLSATPAPLDVVAGLRTVHPFDAVYAADLDAIAGGPVDLATIGLLAGIPELAEIWIDAGTADEERLASLLAIPRVRPVLGTESQIDHRLVEAHRHNPRIVLSLDFFADGYRGPERLIEDVDCWPGTVVVMTLAEVGKGGGPDRARLSSIARRAGGRLVVAAGGIRDAADLAALGAAGIAGALVATALHGGRISATDLERLA